MRSRIAMAGAIVALAVVPSVAEAKCRTDKCWTQLRKARAWNYLEREHPWEAKRRKLPVPLKARLARLRWCESTDRYHIAGHHHGAYQYLQGTWLRTIPSLPSRRLRRLATRGPAYTASPAEQDVRTAFFFPSHSGEWACKA